MAKKKRERRERPADEQSGERDLRESGERDQRESGEPGGGKGRRDEVGPTGVYPPTAENIPDDAEIRMAGSWGGGSYDESGGSELLYVDGKLLGGITAGPDGEPTIDIQGGAQPGQSAQGERGEAQGESTSGETPQSAPGGEAEDRDALRLRALEPPGHQEDRGEQR